MLSRDPLSDNEFEELDDFLLDVEGLDASMDVSMLDGYFAAILSGPKTILPSEWLRWVWDIDRGEDNPVFEGTEQAQRIMSLLMRYMNHVAATLLEAPEDYEPLLFENVSDEHPLPIIDEWCTGYMKGISLDATGWLQVTAGHPDWLSTIILYGTDEGWEQLKRRAFSEAEHRQRAASLGDTVRKIHAHFLTQRTSEVDKGVTAAVRRQPIRNQEKVGRNEACPCGSGKKYKQCHGSPTRLH